MDGVEFLRHLGNRNFQGGLILMSGTDDKILSTAKQLAITHGMHVLDVLQKPITIKKLHDVLQFNPNRKLKNISSQSNKYSLSEQDIRLAIKNNYLKLYCQPKISLQEFKLAGVEVLVRCNDPSSGIILPKNFIPVAEETDLISDITKYIVRELFHYLKEKQSAFSDEINFSSKDLEKIEFFDYLLMMADEYKVNLHNIVVEVTESCLSHNYLATSEVLTRFRLNHIGVSIDDFGTGFSNLVNLKSMPFNEMKLDRQFVHGASENAVSQAILECNILMANKLRLTTVAEGVENKADLDLLKELKCDLVQGYIFAKPFPLENLEHWKIAVN